jgi:hypothetical protein
MRSLCIRHVAPMVAMFALLGCGSAPESGAFDEDPGDGSVGGDGTASDTTAGGDTGGGSDTGVPGTDTGLPPGDTTVPPSDTTPPPVDTGPGPVTLDNVCERMVEAICSPSTKTCCTSRSVPYSDTGCRANTKKYCDVLVAEAKAGSRKFDATKVDGCTAAWKTLTTMCSVPTLSYVKIYAICDQVFNGPTAPGDGPCTIASDCSAAVGALASCNSGDTCENFVIVSKDQPCNYDGDTKRLCDYGLYCSFSTGSGKCATAKGLGSGGCFGSSDQSCGWGNRCDTTNHCAPGAAVGTFCSSDLQCASWSCNATGRCSDPNVQMAIPSTCGGG